MATPIKIFFVVSDGNGEKSRMDFDIDPTGVTLTNISTFLDALWTIVTPMVTGHLETAGFTLEVDTSGFSTTVADVLSDVQEKAEFIFGTVTGLLKRLSIPTFLETLFGSGGADSTVDQTDTSVATFITAVESGITVGGDTITFTNIHGDDIDSIKTATQAWGRNRK